MARERDSRLKPWSNGGVSKGFKCFPMEEMELKLQGICRVKVYSNPDREDISKHEIRAANILVHLIIKELANRQTNPNSLTSTLSPHAQTFCCCFSSGIHGNYQST